MSELFSSFSIILVDFSDIYVICGIFIYSLGEPHSYEFIDAIPNLVVGLNINYYIMLYIFNTIIFPNLIYFMIK